MVVYPRCPLNIWNWELFAAASSGAGFFSVTPRDCGSLPNVIGRIRCGTHMTIFEHPSSIMPFAAWVSNANVVQCSSSLECFMPPGKRRSRAFIAGQNLSSIASHLEGKEMVRFVLLSAAFQQQWQELYVLLQSKCKNSLLRMEPASSVNRVGRHPSHGALNPFSGTITA